MDELIADNENSGSPPSGKNHHLDLAVTHCNQSWFPINPDLLAKIQASLRSGHYDNGTNDLIVDLKKDFSLFIYTIKKLLENRNAKGTKLPEQTPIELIESAKLEELAAVLSVSEGSVSSHKFLESNELQATRLKHSMISATVTELLADYKELDSDLGFSAALFRQLGLTLIAWNYPHVYKRAIGALKPGEKLDLAISKVLGFSPSMLGVSLAKQWGLSTDIRVCMGDSQAKEELKKSGGSSVIGETFETLCKVGEALARASNPDQYPSAKHDWSEAKTELEATLGADAFKILRDKLDENCRYYAKLSPEVFNFPTEIIPKPKVSTPTTNPLSKSKRDLLKENQYLKHCPLELQEQLKELYAEIDGATISRGCIDKIAKQIIPQTGFIRGCIFLIEPDSLSLVPRLNIGMAAPGHFRAVNYQAASSEFDPIVAAFRCQYPIMEENVLVNEDTVSYVAGALGERQKAGVLYLEIGQELLSNRNINILIIYKALRQALCDCLNLR